MGDREPATIMLEDDTDLPSEVPPSVGAIEGIPLHDVKAGTGGHLWKFWVLSDEMSRRLRR